MKKIPARFIFIIGFTGILTHAINAQWVQTNGPPWSGSVTTLAVSGGTVFAGTDGGGVFLSTDGASWTAVDSGLTGMIVNALAVSGSALFAGTGDGVFLSIDNAKSWTAASSGLSPAYRVVRSFAASGSSIFAGTDSGVFISTNNGASWTSASYGLTYMDVFALATIGSNILAGTNDAGVYLSTNSGAGWTTLSSLALPNGIATNGSVTALAVNGGAIFAAASDVYLSTNGGASWGMADTGLTTTGAVSCFAVSGSDIFAGIGGVGLDVGTNGGVSLSTNNAATWTTVDSGFTVHNVTSLVVSGSSLFAGTNSGGVWRRPISEMVGATLVKSQQGIWKRPAFEIHTFGHANPAVAIEFSLPRSDRVTIKVYDLSGNEIVSLVNNYFESGIHNILWNTRNLAEGCYAVKMQAGPDMYAKSVPVFR